MKSISAHFGQALVIESCPNGHIAGHVPAPAGNLALTSIRP